MKILVFVAGTILLGAFLAPLLYQGGKLAVSRGWLRDAPGLGFLHESMERARFSRYFNRALLISAVAMLFPTLRWLNANRPASGGWRERLGIKPNPRWKKDLTCGFFLAAVPLFLLGWFYLRQGWYVPGEAKSVGPVLLGALGTGLAVALLEEFIFRGALTSVFSPLLKPWPLLFAIAAFFAAVHFLKPPFGAELEKITMFSGFRMLGLIFQQFGDWYFLVAEFAVLFAIGCVLGYTRMRTSSLWLAIGLHAGWVFGAKTLGALTVRNFQPSAMMPWLGADLRAGLASALVVCLTGLITWLALRPRPSTGAELS